MVSPLISDKSVAVLNQFSPEPDIRPELLLRLQGRLQTSLNLQQLLDIYFQEIQNSVPVDGIRFSHKALGLLLECGTPARHHLRYQIQPQQHQGLGELIFSRRSRFREQELANIEGTLTAFMYPLRNALLYHQALAAAYKDPLTGAGNRAAMNTTLEREITLSQRYQRPLSTLMLDIDYFKSINDNHGHATGDEVLVSVVKEISQTIRSTDMCFRYGGEEFLIILNDTNKVAALEIAERMRESIESLRFMTDNGLLQITASIGCATLAANMSENELLKIVDKQLYKAKQAGRNLVR